jgi:hypothetical protein
LIVIFPLAVGALPMLIICLAAWIVPPEALPLQEVPFGSVNVRLFAETVAAVELMLYVETEVP